MEKFAAIMSAFFLNAVMMQAVMTETLIQRTAVKTQAHAMQIVHIFRQSFAETEELMQEKTVKTVPKMLDAELESYAVMLSALCQSV